MTRRLAAALLVLATVLTNGASAASAQELPPLLASWGDAGDVATLRALIMESGAAFNRRDPEGIMALYARDVVLSYPGIPDLTYDSLANAYARLRTGDPGITQRTSPTIDEIMVSGDLAVIRLRWHTTTTWTSPARQATRELKDLQVWRREADGRWKFVRGMHYRVSPPMVPPATPPDSARRSGS